MAFSFLYLAVRALFGVLVGCVIRSSRANLPDLQGNRVCEPTGFQNDSSAWKRDIPGREPEFLYPARRVCPLCG